MHTWVGIRRVLRSFVSPLSLRPNARVDPESVSFLRPSSFFQCLQAMSSATLWLPSRLLGFVNVLYFSSFANLFNHPKSTRNAGNCPLRWLNETGLERWAREMDPAPSLMIGETNRQLQRDHVDYLGERVWPV